MKLYHGSTLKVEKPSLSYGKPTADFGRGFYTTTNYDQAAKWAKLRLERDDKASKAIVSVYEVPDDLLANGYVVRSFEGATKEWLDFVVANRRGQKLSEAYDLCVGPVANDKVYTVVNLYINNVISAETAIEMLKSHKLFDQITFHSPKVVSLLRFIEAVEV